jgi:hypothetical protein
MNNTPDTTLRAALLRLGTSRTAGADDVPLPLLFRAPAIALMWIAAITTLVGLLALGRVRVPLLARGVAVAADAGDESSLLLLLPANMASRVAAGQRAMIDVGEERPVSLAVVSVETSLMDASAARRRFPGSPAVLTHFDTPKAVAVLATCSEEPRCLTRELGQMYPATAALGTRSLASYAWPDKSPFAR